MKRKTLLMVALALCLLMALPVLAQEETPEPAVDAIVFEEFEWPHYGITGIAPENWGGLVPGVYSRPGDNDDIVSLLYQPPAATIARLVQPILPAMGLEALPDTGESIEVGDQTWTFYRLTYASPTGGPVAVGMAITEIDGLYYLIMLQSTPDEYDALFEMVLLPALEAYTVSAPSAADGEVVMEPVTLEAFNVETLVPQSWPLIVPGVYSRNNFPGDITYLVQQGAQGATIEGLISGLLPSLLLEETPESTGTLESGLLTWELYEGIRVQAPEIGLIVVDFAVTEAEGTGYIILFQAFERDYETLREQVFLPALNAFTPLSLVPPVAAEDIEMVEYSGNGFEAVAPEGWEEVEPGAFVRGMTRQDPTGLLFAPPFSNRDQFLANLLPNVGLEELPDDPVAYSTDALDWMIYSFEMEVAVGMVMRFNLALADTDDLTYLIILQSPVDEADGLYEYVLLPALDAFVPVEEAE